MKKFKSEDYKDIVLNIMGYIDNICRDNSLEYMIFYGSLLGAVRHKGFIPWDDDIDIVMPRDSYDKLRDIINQNDDYYYFIDFYSSDDTIYSFGKICDTRTTVIDKNFRNVSKYGAFVDVFPLDNFNPNKKDDCNVVNKCKRLNRIKAIFARKKPSKELRGIKYLKGIIASAISSPQITRRLIGKIDSLSRTLNSEIKLFYCVSQYDHYYSKNDLFPCREYDFEGKLFYGPNNYDLILRYEYGDYMKLPPEDERIPHSIDCYWN